MVRTRVRYVDSDILIIGGGMAGTGAAWEARYWCRNCRIILAEKANINRSGAVAMGLSAINTYMGLKCRENTVEDYVKYVRGDLMGIVREDLVYDYARHVDSTVHLFDEWGLPIWPDPKTGCYVREGKWQIMIHGESYKAIVAEAARKAIGDENILNRVMVTHLLKSPTNPNRVVGALGFNVNDGTIYVFRAKAVIMAAGGGSQIYRPRSQGEGLGRSWYPPWSSASSYGMMIEAGAVMTMMEARFVVPRFKDGYGPVGAYQLLLKTRISNVNGQDFWKPHLDEIRKLYSGKGRYVDLPITPTNLRVYAQRLEWMAGRGPSLMRTDETVKKGTESEAVAFEDFLDMTISQVGIWAGQNHEPSERPYEVITTEPYVMGSHATECGAWASGPEDLSPRVIDGLPSDRRYQYYWGYNRMTTLDGLFCAGDACGANPHKFSSGSFTEGRLAAKAAVLYLMDHSDERVEVDRQQVDSLTAKLIEPLERWEKGKNTVVTGPGYMHPIDPGKMYWKQGLFRLQKIMDEYAGGWSTMYITNEWMLNRALELIQFLKEDFIKYAVAQDWHELMRTWELWHRILTAEAVVRHMQFRKETRWPGYYVRADYPALDDDNWHVFVNSKYDAETGRWELWKVPVVHIIEFP